MQQQIKKFWPIYLVSFLAFIGISLPLPLFAPLFLGDLSPFFGADTLISTKKMYLGLALGAFPLGEFFGAPILGRLADRYSKKIVMLMAQIGVALGYFICAYCVFKGNLYFLLGARFLTGLFEGTVGIGQTFLAQETTNNSRAKSFALLTTFISLGYVSGPIVSGIFSPIHFSLPFIVVGIVSLISAFLAQIFLKESNSKKFANNNQPKAEVISIRKLLQNKKFTLQLIGSTISTMAQFLYLEFISVHLMEHFQWDSNQLSYYFILISIVWGVSALFVDWGHKVFCVNKRIMIFSIFSGILLVLLPFLSPLMSVIISVPLVFVISINSTLNAVAITNQLQEDEQGLGQGIKTSIRVLGDFSISIIGAKLLSVSYMGPFILGGIFFVLSGKFFLKQKN